MKLLHRGCVSMQVSVSYMSLLVVCSLCSWHMCTLQQQFKVFSSSRAPQPTMRLVRAQCPLLVLRKRRLSVGMLSLRSFMCSSTSYRLVHWYLLMWHCHCTGLVTLFYICYVLGSMYVSTDVPSDVPPTGVTVPHA